MRMQAGGVGFYPTGMTPWVHIDSGVGALLAAHEPRRADPAVPGRQDGVHSGRRQADARLRAGAGRDRGARRRDADGERRRNRRALLLAVRPCGGADDAEESGGQEATTAHGGDDRQRAAAATAAGAAVQIADVGPEAVAKAKRDMPTGPAYAGPAEPAPAAKPQAPDSGPEAVARAKRNLPTGPAYASAAEPAPTPPVKPQAVAALQQPDVASDASTDSAEAEALRAAAAAQAGRSRSPLALADAPMPPARPADLILASATEAGGGAFAPPSNKGFNAAAPQDGSLPKVITAGVDRAPTGALALAEGLTPPIYDDSELLARAAELTAPLPPMPIPNIGRPPRPRPTRRRHCRRPGAAAAPQTHGWFVRTAALAAEDLAQLFGGVFRSGAPAASNPPGPASPQP